MRSSELDNSELIPLEEVPMWGGKSTTVVWAKRFNSLSEDKAAMVRFNNRQRVHQVRQLVLSSARYWGVSIRTRIIHAEPSIHGTDGWPLYYWKDVKEVK